MNTKGLFDINLNRLEDDWINHPKITFTFARKLAKARKKVGIREANLELAKTERKEVEAELSLSIRQNPEKFKLSAKPTMDAIANAVLLQKSYKQAKAKEHKAQLDVNIAWTKVNLLQGIMDSLNDKKAAMENAVKLHGQNYFSVPRIDGTNEDAKKFLDKSKKQSTRNKGKQNVV